MFSVPDTSKPVTRSELQEELEEYATKEQFRLHIAEVERIVSSLSAVTKLFPVKVDPQDGPGNAEMSEIDLKQRMQAQISFGQKLDEGLIQIRLSLIKSNCDRLRSAVEHLEARLLEKLEAVERLGARVLEKLDTIEGFNGQVVEKLEIGRQRTRRRTQ